MLTADASAIIASYVLAACQCHLYEIFQTAWLSRRRLARPKRAEPPAAATERKRLSVSTSLSCQVTPAHKTTGEWEAEVAL
jgi:hypothetical protein